MRTASQLACGEPVWTPLGRHGARRIPKTYYRWLADQGSLTRAVVGACAGRFHVALLQQGWGRPLTGEARLLMVPGTAATMVREVKLLCDDEVQVFARTLIPATSLRGRTRRLAHLRERPLGAVLFADPATRRRRIELARLTARHTLFRSACSHLEKPPAALWGRRTLFEYAGHPLLVNEIFLPALVEKT